MFGIETLTGPGRAVATVGLVFAEAIGLYLGYGLLSRTVGSTLIDAVGGE